jgi:hypothetical protein
MGFVFCDSYYPTEGGWGGGGPTQAMGGGKVHGCIMHQVHTSTYWYPFDIVHLVFVFTMHIEDDTRS